MADLEQIATEGAALEEVRVYLSSLSLYFIPRHGL